MQFRSIEKKLLVLNGIGLLAALLVMLLAGLWASGKAQDLVRDRTSELSQSAARQQLSLAADKSGHDMIRQLEDAYHFSRAVGVAAASIGDDVRGNLISPAAGREQIMKLTEQLQRAMPKALGVWLVFEPNGFDGRDSQFGGRAELASNEAGRVSIYWAYNQAGEIVPEAMTEEDLNDTALGDNGLPGNLWVTCALKEKTGCFVEPYVDDVDGVPTLMSSATVPILRAGKAVGVAGIDYSLVALKEMANSANSAMYGGAGRTMLLSSIGVVVADSGNADNIGKKLSALSEPWAGGAQSRLSQSQIDVRFNDGDDVEAMIPLPLADGHSQWQMLIRVPTPVVMAEAEKLNAELNSANDSATVIQLVIALAVAAVALFLVAMTARALARPIKGVTETLQEIAKGGGDLTRRLPVASEDEIGQLASAFNEFLTRLQNMMKAIAECSAEVNQAAAMTAQLSEKTSQEIAAQQTDIDMVATAVTEMSSAIQEVAGGANQAATAADSASNESRGGQKEVNSTVGAIQALATDVQSAAQVIRQLADDSAQIGNILDVIRGIAEQTNLLALNAAIEAARAGEQGRGFAVVADEVRNLAQRTHTSTQEIQNMIGAIQASTERAVAAMTTSRGRAEDAVSQADRAGLSLQTITTAITTISDMNTQIATAVEEQTMVTEELTRNITSIRDVAEMLARGAHDNAGTGSQLKSLADRLQQLVGQFRL
ncbi:methyl-accepting chemotaxis protein [Permianibacter sp. IMCC34836]|uniref:methyl-accepting chemotaxis protein n=1 Tax=Permianibacter fluminis TaxID=2738515 RepID=UPI00155166AE|nr:methyl-accepting chemotaxis protein [Permianibacter fluminis]NQD37070.1 methyl-accepting chemotaxis protein [Permianibacter fluminis]